MFRWAGDMRKFQHNTSTYETASVTFIPYLTHDFKVLGTQQIFVLLVALSSYEVLRESAQSLYCSHTLRMDVDEDLNQH